MNLEKIEVPKYLKDKYGEEYTFKAMTGTSVDLRTLNDNESVVSGDGKTYYWLLTMHSVSEEKELLPNFLLRSVTGELIFRYIEDTDVSEEWEEFKKLIK